MIKALREDEDLLVGDNLPYSGRHIADYSIDHHAEKNGFAHVCVEVRQDLISSESGIEEWADRLSTIFGKLLEDESLYTRL